MNTTILPSYADQSGTPANAFHMRRVWQAPLWLFLQPAAWRTYLARIDPALAPQFCLAGLAWSHWRNPLLQHLLWIGYFAWPAFIGIALSVSVWLAKWLDPLALFGWALGSSLGLIVGAVISAAAGMVVAIVTGLTFGLIWGTPHLIALDIVAGPHFALVFGVTSALIIYITGNLTQLSVNTLLFRQAGSFVLGFLASLLLSTGFVAAIVTLIQANQADLVTGQALGLAVGGIPGLVLGLAAAWRTRSWRGGAAVGLLCWLYIAALYGNVGGAFERNPGGQELIAGYSVITAFLYIALFVLPYVLVERLAGEWAGVIAGALTSLAIHAIADNLVDFYGLERNLAVGSGLTLLGISMTWWRPLLFYPFEAAWNTLLLRLEREQQASNATYLFWHAAFWDELQFLPLYGLDDHLVLLTERNPTEGQIALDYISASRQRWAARAAQIELDARRLERCVTIEQIAAMRSGLTAGDLEGPVSALLRRFRSAGNDIAVGLSQISTYNQRLVLMAVEQELNGLLLDLTRSTDPYAQRFQPIAHGWRQTVAGYVQQLAVEAELRGEIPNPYVVGVPLTKHQEIFVGRTDISARIEQLLQDTNHPPLLLYGQRRMGKTSLLYNLRWLLPHRIVPLFVDLQGPVALATDHAGFLYNIAKAIYTSAHQQKLTLTQLSRELLAADPFTVFDDWLDRVEMAAVDQGRTTLLLALDEFEALDSALRKGRLSDEAVLGTLRHIIQHRERFKLLLAGSHTLDEFARWSSYLINAQMVHLSYLSEPEARQLIEQPIQDFPLVYAPDASQHVLALTRGHPYLVQLLCSEIVLRKNEGSLSTRRYATVADVEAAVPIMLTRGRQFFADIALHQVDVTGLRVLQRLAKQGEDEPRTWESLLNAAGNPDELHQTLALLLRRELIEQVQDGYRFQVEVIRRWFAQA